MIKTGCPNPDILAALARCMHGDKVLICTGNLRFNRSSQAKIVYLAVKEGLPLVTDVVEALADTVNFEKAEFMDMPTPEKYLKIHQQILNIFPMDMATQYYQKADFHDLTGQDNVALIIVTGDTRMNANVLLTVYL